MKPPALILLISLPLPAFAGPLTTGTCQEVFDLGIAALGQTVESGAPSLSGAGCVVRDIVIPSQGDSGVKVEIGSLTFSGDGLDPQGDWLAAESLQVTAKDLRIVPQPFDAQNSPDGFDLVIDLSHDASGNVWKVNQFRADLPGDNGWVVNAQVKGLDLTSRSAATLSLAGARLTNLNLQLDMDGFVETYILSPFDRLPIEGSSNPDVRVNELKTQAISLIRTLPEASVDANSKAALSDLITDLPKPRGRLEVTLNSDTGFGAPNLMPLVLNGLGDDPAKALATLVNGVQIDVTWTRAP